MTNHLSRQELIAAAGLDSADWGEHLKACGECRELLEWIRAFPVWGKAPLADAPDAWIARAEAAGPAGKVRHRVKEALARLAFDSWALPEPVGVREEGVLEHRRVRFESEYGDLDLRGERVAEGWMFVAQWTGHGEATGEVTIHAGRTSLHPDEYGMVQWKGRRPPANLRIRTGDYVVQTPGLSWKVPRSD